jgi:hypothetical protein
VPHGLIDRLKALRPAPGLRRALGLAFVVTAVAFVGAQVVEAKPWTLERALVQDLAMATLIGAGIYGLAGFVLAEAWIGLLDHRPTGVSRAALYAAYGRSQIGKYLPGNVFHLLGRHALGRRLGLGHGRLLDAAVFESACLVAVAAGIGLLAIALGPAVTLPLTSTPAMAVISATGLPPVAPWTDRLLRFLEKQPRRLIRATLFHLVFFVVAGLVFASLTEPVAAVGLRSAVAAIGTFALAWLAGFLTPGAPAGVGVREAVLLMALPEPMEPAVAAGVVLALRLATTGGDLLFFFVALALPLDRHDAPCSPLPGTPR